MLHIIASNNILIRGASTPLRAEITKALTMDNPEYVDRKKRRISTWGIDQKLALWIPQGTDIIAPRGFLDELTLLLKDGGLGCSIEFRYSNPQPVDFGAWNPDYPPRDYQQPAIAALVANNGVVEAPAGAGKTLIMCRAIYEIGLPALWLTHTIDLVKQAKDAAAKYMPGVGQVGLLADGKLDWGSGKLFVATAQTLLKNPQLMRQLNDLVGCVVVDEAHHFPAPMFNEVVGQFTARHVKGATATVERKDRLEKLMLLGIGPVLHKVPREGLYESGSLIKPTVKFLYTNFVYRSPGGAENSVDAGGEDLDYLALMRALCQDEARLELVAREIVDNVTGNCMLVLADNIRYLYSIKAKVTEICRQAACPPLHDTVIHGSLERYAWYAARGEKDARRRVESGEAIDCRRNERLKRWEIKVRLYTDEQIAAWDITPKQRAERIQALRDRKVQVVYATAQLVQEGLDIPHLTVGVLATPKRGDAKEKDRKGGSAVEQAIGRIQRPDPLNPHKAAIWIDVVDDKVGVFKDQYYSRRKVYTRLGLPLPKKKAEVETRNLDTWLGRIPY